MRPAQMTPAHRTGALAELVCSNSLGTAAPTNAAGLLKAELGLAGGMLLRAAAAARVPAGKALAVDRELFSAAVERDIAAQPGITRVGRELTELPAAGPAIIATGPLTSAGLAATIASFAGEEHLYFYDAVAPVITAASVDPSRAFWASRYDEGGDDYLNCPLNESEYAALREALHHGERHQGREFERGDLFEACLPVEELARRGRDTLRYGPLKPVGLTDPATGQRPYAVVQLRREDADGRLLNLVGFQTNLTFGAQKQALRLIPALAGAEFVRLGVMHRNTYINSPTLLRPTYESRRRPGLFFAGQLTGVEGYTESIASGLVAALSLMARRLGQEPTAPPRETLLGALGHHVSSAPAARFQPMNANFGLLPALPGRPRRRERAALYVARSTAALTAWLAAHPGSNKP